MYKERTGEQMSTTVTDLQPITRAQLDLIVLQSVSHMLELIPGIEGTDLLDLRGLKITYDEGSFLLEHTQPTTPYEPPPVDPPSE